MALKRAGHLLGDLATTAALQLIRHNQFDVVLLGAKLYL